MIDLLIHPDDDGKFTLLMPLNDDEGIGSMETSIPFDESTIPQPFQDNIIAELAKSRFYNPNDPDAELRGPGFPGQSWRGFTPPGVAEAATARLKTRRGQQTSRGPVIYFLHKGLDVVHEHDVENVFDDSRLFQTVGSGDNERQIPADPIDDGIYIGPHIAQDAKALVGGP